MDENEVNVTMSPVSAVIRFVYEGTRNEVSFKGCAIIEINSIDTSGEIPVGKIILSEDGSEPVEIPLLVGDPY